MYAPVLVLEGSRVAGRNSSAQENVKYRLRLQRDIECLEQCVEIGWFELRNCGCCVELALVLCMITDTASTVAWFFVCCCCGRGRGGAFCFCFYNCMLCSAYFNLFCVFIFAWQVRMVETRDVHHTLPTLRHVMMDIKGRDKMSSLVDVAQQHHK